MATIPIHPMEQAKTVSGNSPFTLSLPEAATQSFKKGAVLTLNSVGHVIEGAASEDRVLGVAQEDAHNDAAAATSNVLVAVANADNIFTANVGGSGVTHSSDIGRSFNIAKEGNYFVIDKTSGTRVVLIVDFDRRDTIGDTNGRLLFIFHGNVRALEGTS